jgi:squalene-hopene/tetraprenyl-beta-curcumene cyclase
MKKYLDSVVMAFSVVFLVTIHVVSVRAEENEKKSWNPKATARYLDERADWWLQWSGSARGQGTACISCHTALPIALAQPALLRGFGETTAGGVEQRLVDNVKKRVENWDKITKRSNSEEDAFRTYYTGERRASSLGTESVLNALVLVNHDHRLKPGATKEAGSKQPTNVLIRQEQSELKESTRKALVHMWEQQKENGAWHWLEFGTSPWEKDAEYFGACLGAIAVGSAGKDYFTQADIQPKVAALVKYLKNQFPNQPLHNQAMCLWASSRLPGILSEQETKKLIDELLNVQESDGGWSLPKLGKPGVWTSQGAYPEGAISDGYATGLVVLALKRAGLTASNARNQRGIAWLENHQKDGTWPVHYLNKKRDPNTDTGKFMRDAATSFAILALTEPSD